MIWNDTTTQTILIQSLTAAVIVVLINCVGEVASRRRILLNLDLKRWRLGAIIHGSASQGTSASDGILFP